MHREETIEEFKKQFNELRNKGVKFYEVALQDLHGHIRGRILKPEKPEDVLKGYRVDAYSIGFLPIEDSDAMLIPDPTTLKVYRTRMGLTAFLIGDLYKDGKPLDIYPRTLLREYSRSKNYRVLMGAELEFYLTKNHRPIDNGSYMYLSPYSNNSAFLAEAIIRAEEAGVAISATHHEVGPSQYEILPKARTPLELADEVVFLKKLLWETAYEKGLEATFMPKPFKGLPGNGLHIHVSLHNGERNIAIEEGEITETGKRVVGGLLSYSSTFALLTNPTVNSYKRLAPGFEAPVYISWGRGNRTTMIRLPVGLKGLSGTIEYRLPDPAGNIYLKILSVLYSTVKGLEENLTPPPETRENLFEKNGLPRVPQSLGEAINISQKSPSLPRDLKKLTEKMVELKTKEWDTYSRIAGNHDPQEITDWEIKEYFFL